MGNYNFAIIVERVFTGHGGLSVRLSGCKNGFFWATSTLQVKEQRNTRHANALPSKSISLSSSHE